MSTRGEAAAPAGRSSLPRYPDLLRRPLARPVDRHVDVVLVRDGISGRLELDEPLDLEARTVQHGDPIAMRELEIDALPVLPLQPVQPEIRALQLGRDRAGPRVAEAG